MSVGRDQGVDLGRRGSERALDRAREDHRIVRAVRVSVEMKTSRSCSVIGAPVFNTLIVSGSVAPAPEVVGKSDVGDGEIGADAAPDRRRPRC